MYLMLKNSNIKIQQCINMFYLMKARGRLAGALILKVNCTQALNGSVARFFTRKYFLQNARRCFFYQKNNLHETDTNSLEYSFFYFFAKRSCLVCETSYEYGFARSANTALLISFWFVL